MPESLAAFTVVFPAWYDELAEYDHEAKGYLPGVEVRLAAGGKYLLYFSDPVRLRQDAEVELELHASFFEPNLVVVAQVTRERIRAAVAELYRLGSFASLCPLLGSGVSEPPGA